MALTNDRRENLIKLAAMKSGWGDAKDSDMKKFFRTKVAPKTSMASNRLSNARRALAGDMLAGKKGGIDFKEMLGLGSGVAGMTGAGAGKAADKATIKMLAKKILGLESSSKGKGGKQMEGSLGGKSMAGLGGKQTAIERSKRRGGRQMASTIGRSSVGDGGGRQMEEKLLKSMRRAKKRLQFTRNRAKDGTRGRPSGSSKPALSLARY